MTDLVSRGYLVFSDKVGVKASFGHPARCNMLAYSARCNMLLLFMYMNQQLCMEVSGYEMK